MSEIKGVEIEDIALADIEIAGRVRQVSLSVVNIIVMSIEDLGCITSPIHVRKMRAGFRLIDGAHRLNAAKQLGLETIPAKIWECTAEQADLMDSDANVSTAQMFPLELAVSLAARKKPTSNCTQKPQTARQDARQFGAISRERQKCRSRHGSPICTA